MKNYGLILLVFTFVCIFFCWGFMLGQHFGKKPVNRWRKLAQTAVNGASTAAETKEKTAEQRDQCFDTWDTLRTKWDEHKSNCPQIGEPDSQAETGVL